MSNRRPIRRFTSALFAMIVLTGSLVSDWPLTAKSANSTPQDPTAAVTAQIVEARDYTAEFVSIAKTSFVKDPPNLVQARERYAAAYSKYNGWVAYVATSLRQGKAKKLNQDSTYQNIANDASHAATEFTTFVASNAGQEKAISTILSSLADLGIKLWNGIKDRIDKDRANAADAFEKETKWQPWDNIGTEARSKSKPDSQKK